jgi:hypothetical protein
MRFLAPAIASAMLAVLVAAPVRAQRVAGEVLRADSTTPAAQVLIEWRTPRTAVQRLLTNQQGRFLLTLSMADSVYLRILRPGFRPQELRPFYVAEGTATPARIILEERAVVLQSMRISGESACSGRTDASAWTLLEQARTAMLAASLAERDPALVIEAVEYEGDGTPAGAIVLRDSSVRRSPRSAPVSSAQRDSIFRFGYVRRTSDTSYYHAPTPDVLLDERFDRRYCLTLVPADSSPDGLLGVRFVPARRPGPGIADVMGAIWLDEDRYLLSRVEFEYLNVPPSHRVEGLGGYLEFAVLPTGHWLLREWLFRMPNIIWTRRAEMTVLKPDGSCYTSVSGEPICRAVPIIGARGLWARGRIVYRVSLNGRTVLTDSSGAALLERETPAKPR